MLTDYKFNHITYNGETTHCKVTFYEGDYVLNQETDIRTGIVSNVTRYRRTGRLRTQVFPFVGNFTDKALSIEINKELKKDATRTPIPEQKNA